MKMCDVAIQKTTRKLHIVIFCVIRLGDRSSVDGSESMATFSGNITAQATDCVRRRTGCLLGNDVHETSRLVYVSVFHCLSDRRYDCVIHEVSSQR